MLCIALRAEQVLGAHLAVDGFKMIAVAEKRPELTYRDMLF